MRQTLSDDFWGLNKNMNCAFPLKRFKFLTLKFLKYFFCLAYRTHTKIYLLSIFTPINFRYRFIKSVFKPGSCNNCFAKRLAMDGF